MNYKDLIYQELCSGESIENIMKKITTAANEAQKLKESSAAPWKNADTAISDLLETQLDNFFDKKATDDEMMDIFLTGICANHPDLRKLDSTNLRDSLTNWVAWQGFLKEMNW